MADWGPVWAMVKLAVRADRARAVAASVLTVAMSIQPVVVAFLIGRVTDAVVARELTGAVVLGVAVAAAVGGQLALLWYTFGVRTVLEEKVRHLVEMRLAELCLSGWSLHQHEDPEFADELSLVERDVSRLAQVTIFALTLVGAVIQLVFSLVVLGSVQWALAGLPVLGLLPVLAGKRGDARRQESLERAAPRDRVAQALFATAGGAEHAAELAVLGAEAGVRRRHRELSDAAQREREHGAYRALGMQADAAGLFGLAYVGAIVLAILAAVSARASIGGVMLTVTLAAQVTGQVAVAADVAIQLARSKRTAARFTGLAERVRPAPALKSHVDGEGTSGLTLRGVDFTYPGAATPALRNVDLRLETGQTIAIVGENGAGKTTLAKMLCRLYDPTGGAIEWNGHDLRSMEVEEWRSGLSAAYQDFVRFEVRAGQAVGLGDLPRLDDEAATHDALARADGERLVGELPRGLATELGRSFPDGTELSTGQWQKLAVGRSMMRRAPRLLVLDEPTASLDPETERRLFERYAQAASAVREAGQGLVVVITHRLGSIRFADRIVVIEGGAVVETGTHDELIAADGRYARLYRAQAEAYSIDDPEADA